MTEPTLHADIAHLSWLVGTWAGKGSGEYPTIESFDYTEEVVFGHVGKPFLSYIQRTRHAKTGLPLHAEAGYFRPAGADRVEFLVVQPSGIMELHDGVVDGTAIRLESLLVTTSASAKDVTKVERNLEVDTDAGVLSYALNMAAVGLPLQHHLAATLHRTA